MSIHILTSLFAEGFPSDFGNQLRKLIYNKNKFVFVASEFEKNHEKTDEYFSEILDMFEKSSIHFQDTYVIDSRISMEEAQSLIMEEDVLWLSGGDTPVQYQYFISYGLVPAIRNCRGIVIGMSAGAINMAKTAVCTLSCGHSQQLVYDALGLADISVETHFDKNHISKELLELSQKYPIYGICDNSAIICMDDKMSFLGKIFLIDKGKVTEKKN